MWKIILTLFVIWRIIYLWKNRKLLKLSRQLKNLAISLPFIGHSYKFFGNDEVQMNALHYFGREAIKQNGLTAMWIGEFLCVVVADPVDAEVISKKFLEKSELMRYMRAVIGNGSISAPVNIWRPRRKILLPNFNLKNLNQFVSIFAKQSNVMVEQLKSKVDNGTFSLWSYLTTYTMDSVCESTLGVKIEAQKNHDHPFLKNFAVGSELVATRILSPWQHHDVIYQLFPSSRTLQKCQKYLFSFIDTIIGSKRKSIKEQQGKVTMQNGIDTKQNLNTFLNMMIENSGGETGYTDVELREEILVLLMAGTDTSAVGTAFTAIMLSRHLDIQDRVYEELEEVFGNSDRPVTPEDLPRLKYLDAVIRESLRLYPPGPVIVRHCDKDFTLPSGVTVVKGCVLMLNIWAVHRNPKYWGDDAEMFRPERFLDTQLKHPAQFMAFSTGPRNCVGYQYAMMSMKTALATLLRSYRVLPDSPAPAGGHKPLRLKFDIMMKDVDNYIVQLQHRK